MQMVAAWAALHEAELEDNWVRALRGEEIKAIDPLP